MMMVAVAASLASTSVHAAQPVDFVREIRPILSAKCVACHGPEEQAGELRGTAVPML